MNEDWKITASEKPPPIADLSVRLLCPQCKRNPPNIIEEFSDGDLVCGDCGLVIGDRIIDMRSEWRTFENEDDDPSRVGGAADPLFDNAQLDTIISGIDQRTGIAKKLKSLHGRASANKNDRFLAMKYKEISAMCDHAGLPKTIADTTKQLFKRVRELGLLPTRDPLLIIGACLIKACRHEGASRTFKEVAAITRQPMRELGRCHKELQKELKMAETTGGILTQKYASSADLISHGTTSPVDLIPRFRDRLRLNREVEGWATSIYTAVKDILNGKTPATIAATCIYTVSGLGNGVWKHAKDIAPVTGVGENTIKTAYKEVYQHKELLVPILGEAAVDKLQIP